MKNGEIRQGDSLSFDGHGYTTEDKPKKRWLCKLGWHRWRYPIIAADNHITIVSGVIQNKLGHGKCDICGRLK